MNKTTKKPGKRLSAENIATGKRLLKYIMDLYKYRFIMVFICILLSAVASISVSLSLKYSTNWAKISELYRALSGTDRFGMHFPRRCDCNIYLYKNDGIHWTGRVKKSARRYV